MVYVIIQARMNSSRLPGKVLLNICGLPELLHVVNRVNNAKCINKIILATTNSIKDDVIESCCKENNILCFRGSEEDVLDRFYKAAKWAGAMKSDYIVRVTADCPFIDPVVIDKVVETILKSDVDYVSNIIKPTFPDGLDVEVFSYNALELAWKEASLKSEREHVTPYLYKTPNKFKILNVENEIDYSALRWTLDEEEDFEVINDVYQELYTKDNIFNMQDILNLYIERPDVFAKNQKYARNEGYIKSIKADASERLE